MRKSIFAVALCGAMLSGCASMSTDQFAGNVNNVVLDTNSVATGAVSIVTDVAKALISLTEPVTSVLSAIGKL